MRWHTPERVGESSRSMYPAGRPGHRRRSPIPASTDFNASFSGPEDHDEEIGSLADCGDEGSRISPVRQDDTNPENEKRVLIGKLTPGWYLKLPILIRIERDSDGSFIASDDLFAMHGEGMTLHHAVKDYAASLVEYYQLLSARSANDAPTAALFGRLQRYMGPVDE